MYCPLPFTVLCRTQSILWAHVDTLLSPLQMGLVCFILLPWMDGFLSGVMSTIEMRWSHLRGCLGNTCSLPKMYNRKLPSSWLASLHQPHHPPSPTSRPPALVVKGLLPARGGRLLLLELPWPLKGTLSINRDWNSLNEARGSPANTKQEAAPHLACSTLSEYGKMHSIWPDKQGRGLHKCFILIVGGQFYWHIFCAYPSISSLRRNLWPQGCSVMFYPWWMMIHLHQGGGQGARHNVTRPCYQCRPGWQWNGGCHIAIIGKRGWKETENKWGREEEYSTPTGKQNTAICSGRTDWNDYSEGNIQFWEPPPPLFYFIFFCTPPHPSWWAWILRLEQGGQRGGRGWGLRNSHCQIMPWCLWHLGSFLGLWITCREGSD